MSSVIEALRRCLDDPDERVVRFAAERLAKIAAKENNEALEFEAKMNMPLEEKNEKA